MLVVTKQLKNALSKLDKVKCFKRSEYNDLNTKLINININDNHMILTKGNSNISVSVKIDLLEKSDRLDSFGLYFDKLRNVVKQFNSEYINISMPSDDFKMSNCTKEFKIPLCVTSKFTQDVNLDNNYHCTIGYNVIKNTYSKTKLFYNKDIEEKYIYNNRLKNILNVNFNINKTVEVDAGNGMFAYINTYPVVRYNNEINFQIYNKLLKIINNCLTNDDIDIHVCNNKLIFNQGNLLISIDHNNGEQIKIKRHFELSNVNKFIAKRKDIMGACKDISVLDSDTVFLTLNTCGKILFEDTEGSYSKVIDITSDKDVKVLVSYEGLYNILNCIDSDDVYFHFEDTNSGYIERQVVIKNGSESYLIMTIRRNKQ